MKYLKRTMGILTLVSAGMFIFQSVPFLIAGVPVRMKEAAAIGIIGGADGPTAIYIATEMVPYYKITATSAIVFFVFWLILHIKAKNK